jgi:para-aminobenzoate synthetase / 4-amino-4-deoxychorismate lyase
MSDRTGFAVRRPLGWELTPAEVLRLVRTDAHPVALFGAWAGGRDVVAAEPTLVRSAPGPMDEVFDGPLSPAVDGAFGGGWIGYLGYSAGGEALPSAGRIGCLPAWWFGWYDHVLVHEQATGEWFFEALWTQDRAAALERRFANLVSRAAALPSAVGYEFSPFRLLPGSAGHQEAVARTVEYIRQGDIFQANICLRAEARFSGDPLDAFCQAATDLRPPYAAFVGVSATTAAAPAVARAAVASLSPELFLRRTGDAVMSKPIKGTARRVGDATEAAAQLAELKRSAKNRAENVMIVDLVRNDLSRVCVSGTVTVPELLGAEPHPGVWHLVSTVEGTLAGGVSDGDLIRATFPPGSVTGAPKVRALEIIDELECGPREAYTGAIGYRSPVAGLELNVAIRTFEFAAGRSWLGAGGGIVADSDPEAEYAECLIKAAPLLTAIGAHLDTSNANANALAALTPRPSAGVFTSLRVTDGQTRGLADHLARLASSVRDLYGKDFPGLQSCVRREPTGSRSARSR